MTPFQKIVHRMAEKVAGTFHETSVVPARFAELVDEFAQAHPRATRRQWGDMALRLAAEAYRDGFRRGFEHSERDPEPAWQKMPPELVADTFDPEWRHPARAVRPPVFEAPEEVPPEGPAFELDEGRMGLGREEEAP